MKFSDSDLRKELKFDLSFSSLRILIIGCESDLKVETLELQNIIDTHFR